MDTNPTIGVRRPEAYAAPAAPDIIQSAHMVVPRDSVRWGPIWAGVITAISSFVLLEILLYAFGLLSLVWNAQDAQWAGQTLGWVTAIVALIAFFLGGWVAGASALVRGTGAGVLNGFLVWATTIVVIMLLSGMGLGAVFGAAGDLFGRFASFGRATINDLGNINLGQYAGVIQESALWAFVFLLVSAGAAATGGALGEQGEPVGEQPGTEGAAVIR